MGGCGGYQEANPCHCNEHCEKYNSCCNDYNTTCLVEKRMGLRLTPPDQEGVSIKYSAGMIKSGGDDFDKAEPDCLSLCGKSGECDFFCGPAKACCKRGSPENGAGCPLENTPEKTWVDY